MKNFQLSQLYPIFIGLILLCIGLPLSFQHIQQKSFIQEVQAKPIDPGEQPIDPKEKKIEKKAKWKSWFKKKRNTKSRALINLALVLGILLLILGTILGIVATRAALNYNAAFNNSSSSDCSESFIFIIIMGLLIVGAGVGFGLAIWGVALTIISLVKINKNESNKESTVDNSKPKESKSTEKPTIKEAVDPYSLGIGRLNKLYEQLQKTDLLIAQHGESEDLSQQKIKLYKKLKKEAVQIEQMLPQLEDEHQKIAEALENADSKNQEKLQVELAEKAKDLEQAKQIAAVKDDHKALIALMKTFE